MSWWTPLKQSNGPYSMTPSCCPISNAVVWAMYRPSASVGEETSGVRRAQNAASKAAYAHLARLMASSQSAGDDGEVSGGNLTAVIVGSGNDTPPLREKGSGGRDIADMVVLDMQAEEEDDISAILIASIESNSKVVKLSPEDAAWSDSCLVSDPLSDDSWDALKNDLFKIQEEESSNNFDAHINENAEEHERESVEYNQVKEKVEPTLVGNGEEHESLLDSLEEIKLRDHIFKVWELEMHEEDEENELIKQLKKALMKSKYQDSTQTETVDDKLLDINELVAGIGDLSLEPLLSE